MKRKLFWRIFLASMAVFVLTASVLLFFIFRSASSRADTVFGQILQIFTPLLVVLVLAVALAALMASHGARELTEPLDRIDFSRPDERDVDPEFRPLVRRLAEQNLQIRRQMEDLAQEHEKQDRLRREFTANVSHELKTPLTSISGFAELMAGRMVAPADVPRFAGKIYDEAQRLIRLVEDILKLSRMDDRTVVPAQEQMDLYRAAAQALAPLEAAAQRQNVEITLTGEAAPILAAGRMINELIYNLCDNAIKYNHPAARLRSRSKERMPEPSCLWRTRVSAFRRRTCRESLSGSTGWIRATPRRLAARAWACPSSSMWRCTIMP